jgi:hypothetical protein
MPITIHDLAIHRGMTSTSDSPDRFTGGDYANVGLPIMGGCQGCGATIAAYNSYPTTSGYLSCHDCVGDTGYETAEAANADIFPEDA